MKYQEKVAIATTAVEAIKKGETLEEFLSTIDHRDIYAADLSNIRVMVKKELLKKYGQSFQTLLLADQQERLSTTFPELALASIDQLTTWTIEDIKIAGKRSIAKMMKTAESEDEIIAALENKYFSRQEIAKAVDQYLDENPIVTKQDKQNYITKAIFCFIGGIALLFGQSILGMTAMRTMILLIASIAGGIVFLILARGNS